MAARLTQAKYHDCLKAFGHTVFCECLRDNAPVSVGFQTYVRVITTNKQRLKSDKLDEQDRKIVDATHTAREMCVKRLQPSIRRERGDELDFREVNPSMTWATGVIFGTWLQSLFINDR